MAHEPYRAYTLANVRTMPQMARLSRTQIRDVAVVGHVLPFKTNNFVVDHLIDWDQAPEYPLFVLNFAQRDMLRPQDFDAIERPVDYLQANPQISDVLFTGEDPLVMSACNLAGYIEPQLAADLPSLRRIRIGTKALSYWPYRFLTDKDAEDVLALFRRVGDAGLHLALMAHYNHPRELEPEPVRQAIAAIRATGAVIRTQSPLLAHINDDPAL